MSKITLTLLCICTFCLRLSAQNEAAQSQPGNKAISRNNDTIFHQQNKRYQISGFRNGNHLLVTAKYKAINDTVFVYKYGAYYGAIILDAIIYDNHFVCVYRALDMVVCKSYTFTDGRWQHVTGGILFTNPQENKRIEGASIKKSSIRLKADGHVFTFVIDFEQKTVKKKSKKLKFH